MSSKIKNIILLAVVAGIVVFFFFPAWFNTIGTLLFGSSSALAIVAKKQIKASREQAEEAQEEIKKKDLEIAQVKSDIINGIEEHQELGVTIRGKVQEEREKLEEEKTQIHNNGFTNGADAADYIKSILNK